MLAPYGVASAQDLVIRGPTLANLPFYLLLDAGEGVSVHFANPRRFVLDAEEHGVLVLDVILLYYFLSSSLATAARWTSSGPSARRRVRALAQA